MLKVTMHWYWFQMFTMRFTFSSGESTLYWVSSLLHFQRNFNTGEVEILGSTIYHKTEYKERRDHFAFYTVNCPINGYDTDRESFLGLYNGFEHPDAVKAPFKEAGEFKRLLFAAFILNCYFLYFTVEILRYSFYKDARLRRITRYRYNNVPVDMGGRYFYIKDGDVEILRNKEFYLRLYTVFSTGNDSITHAVAAFVAVKLRFHW